MVMRANSVKICTHFRAHLIIQPTPFRVGQHDPDVLVYGLEELSDPRNGSASAYRSLGGYYHLASAFDRGMETNDRCEIVVVGRYAMG